MKTLYEIQQTISGPDMNREFLDFLEDILDGMNKAEVLLEGVSYPRFETDFRINFAVVRAPGNHWRSGKTPAG